MAEEETLDVTVLLSDVKTWTCEGCGNEISAPLGELLREFGFKCECGKHTKAAIRDSSENALSRDETEKLIKDWDAKKRKFVKEHTDNC